MVVWEAHATQVVPLQQPSGHEVASQTHCPCVLLHSLLAGHSSQVAPPAPQEVFVSAASATQEPSSLQQPSHVPPPQVHVPVAEQVSPLPHELQVLPPVPHTGVDCAE